MAQSKPRYHKLIIHIASVVTLMSYQNGVAVIVGISSGFSGGGQPLQFFSLAPAYSP
jgi:hypothetical protein